MTKRRKVLIILILGALSTISPFSIDMYLAAFPQIAADLHSTVAQISLSVSTYFVGLAVGQVVYGPLLDRFGRKKPLYAGLFLFLLASCGCMTARTTAALAAFRFFQALGGCAAQVGATAMVRDFFPVKESSKIFSLLMLILGVSPLLAPTVGSIIAGYLAWQWIFAVLSLIAILVCLAVFLLLPEGHRPDLDIRLRVVPILRTYADVFMTRQFAFCALAGSFSFCGLFAYVAGSPLIFLNVYGVGPRFYGAMFALLSIGLIGGSQANIFLSNKFSNRTMFFAAITAQAFFVLLFLVCALESWLGLYTTVLFFFAVLSCIGIVLPNAGALTLAPFQKNVGSAAALSGLIQIGIGALASSSIGLVNAQSALPVIFIMATTSWTGCFIAYVGRHHIRNVEAAAAHGALIH